MRRALAILKYVPAVLCGLLVVAWVAGMFLRISLICGSYVVTIANGDLRIYVERDGITKSTFPRKTEVVARPMPEPIEPLGHLGVTEDIQHHGFVFGYEYNIPVPLLISILSPAFAALFTRFRFPLWSYFAWTALVAAELAYYLR